ncbi:hypothetical protein D9M71_156000 [compost metagenome]
MRLKVKRFQPIELLLADRLAVQRKPGFLMELFFYRLGAKIGYRAIIPSRSP